MKALSVCLVCLLLSTSALADTHRIPRVRGDIDTDGVLDEALWREALRLELDVEVEPGENIPACVRTEALLAYTDTHLLAGIVAYDPDPSAIRARLCDRDELWGDDWVALILDTFNDNRRCFDFFVNPLGVQADIIESTQGGGDSWNALWDSGGRITDDGYVVEFSIPFRSMRFQRSESDQVWGIDIVRSYPRSVDHRLTLFPRDRSDNCYLCQADEIVGFAGAQPGRNLEITPTFSAIVTQERPDGPDGDLETVDEDYEPGLTARWGFTNNLTLNATLNPDFSQVEADAAQLNINTPFALYFDETRPFFVEDQEFFQTGLNAVHTRTLRDPQWGLKLTGKEGPHALGFFSVQDEVTNVLFPGPQGSDGESLDRRSWATAARYRRDVGSASTLGLLLTDRETDDGYYNRMASFDGRVIMGPKDRVRFQLMGSATKYADDLADDYGQKRGEFTGAAGEVFYLRDTRSLDWYAIYRHVERDLRADLGFVPQTGYRHSEAGWGHTWNHGPDHWWNMLNFGNGFEMDEQLDGELLHRAITFWADYRGLKQSWFSGVGWFGSRGYAGREFDYNHLQLHGGVKPLKQMEMQMSAVLGQGIDFDNIREATRTRLIPSMEFRLGRHLQGNLSHIYERMTVRGGRLYTANISEARLVYQFDHRTFVRAILQYVDYDRDPGLYLDDVEAEDRSLFSQFLFSYKIDPQTVVFLGYSDNSYGDTETSMTRYDRTFFAKLGYAWGL